MQSQEQLQSNNFNNLKSMTPMNRNDLTSESEARSFNRDKALTFEGKQKLGLPANESPDNTQLLNSIVQILKEKHLPGMLNTIKIEINEGISNLKTELNALREELQSHIVKQEAINSEIVSQTSTIINIQAQGKEKNQREGDFAELQTNFFLLEGKITQI
jgi:hypothetical protein